MNVIKIGDWHLRGVQLGRDGDGRIQMIVVLGDAVVFDEGSARGLISGLGGTGIAAKIEDAPPATPEA